MKKVYTLTLGFVAFSASLITPINAVMSSGEILGEPIVIFLTILSLLNITFFIKVKFWRNENKVSNRLEKENLILKKKIKNKKLEKKLSELDNINNNVFDFDEFDRLFEFNKDGKITKR